MLENLRFYQGEEDNDSNFVAELAKLADCYVNDSFSCSHRKHASIYGIAQQLPSFTGLLLEQEIKSLNKYLQAPKQPSLAIIGGAKIATKLEVILGLINTVDAIVIGGAMANSFLIAQGYNIGNSMYEKDYIEIAGNSF